MTHARKTIRQTIVDILQDASITDVGDNVFPDRLIPVHDNDDSDILPCILVFTGDETSVVDDFGSPILDRNVLFTIEGHLQHVDEAILDDKLDDLAEAIEDALDDDSALVDEANTLGLKNVFMDIQLTSSSLSMTASGQKPTGCVKLTYNVRYRR